MRGQLAPGPPALVRTRKMLHKFLKRHTRAVRGILGAGFLLAGTVCTGVAQSSSSSQTGTTAAPGTAPIQSQTVARQILPQRVATYDERFEVFGGLSFMNGQAGQNLPVRYNMGGGEVMGTYWLGAPHTGGILSHLGVSADYRLEAGTTPIYPVADQFGLHRVLVYQNIISGGAEYRGFKNRYFAIDYHALVGASHGTFDSAIAGYPKNLSPQPTDSLVGLYNNSTTPWGAAGGSIDFNQSPRLAVRLSPDIIFEHFGTETREFVSVGGGILYRFGKK